MPIPTITWAIEDRDYMLCGNGPIEVGTALSCARADHVHTMPEPPSTVRQPITCGGCGANVSPKDERCDHCRAWLG